MVRPATRNLRLAAVFVGLAVAKAAQAEETLAPDWLEAQLNEHGQHCDKRAVWQAPGKLMVACGAAGVWEIALSGGAPHFVRSYEFPGDAVGLFTEPDGRLWVKLQVLEARPLDSGGVPGAVQFPDALEAPAPYAPPVATTAAPAPPPSPPIIPAVVAVPQAGRVIKSMPGEVVISLGTFDGVARGDHIELALDHADAAASDDVALSRELLAVGVVTNVTEHSALVRLGVDESVPVGALAARSRAPSSASQSAPPHVTDVTTLELALKPFAALGELGGGFLLSAALGHRFGHLHVWALLDPLAFAAASQQPNVAAANGAAMVSYDSQYFEMGLGLGGQTVNIVNFSVAPGSGYTVAQLLRLGPQDGLNLIVRTNIVLFHSQFHFGGMVASAQFPITRGYWLLLGGGGGNVGYGSGELGLRVLIDGNGLAGSKFLTVSAGGAAVFKSTPCDEASFQAFQTISSCGTTTLGGPMAGVGGEWRF